MLWSWVNCYPILEDPVVRDPQWPSLDSRADLGVLITGYCGQLRSRARTTAGDALGGRPGEGLGLGG